ncbi:MAG TPA: hypothetical protein VFZ25_06540 [Chloroflexota bacterium]|nr:hypothetical protein [Chloroflexota bacterium]
MSRLKIMFAGVLLFSQVLLACASPPATSPTAAAPAPTVAAAPTATTAPAATVAPTAAPAPTTAPVATTARAATAAPTTSAAANASTVQIAKDAKLGDILTGSNGMTLYLYTKDTADTSNCYDQCAQNWPPLITASDPTGPSGLTGKLGTTTRKDGAKQVTYNGMPLYYFAKDTKPGDVAGQEVGYVWYVVPPTMAGFPTIREAKDSKLGEILTDTKGMTLYLFTKDAADTSNCYDQCATNWPPVLVNSGDPIAPAGLDGKLGTTTRKDGSKQVTYNSMPLYYFAADKNVGDIAGQEVGYVWYVVPPTMAGFPTIRANKDAKLGEILTDTKGMTLYRYTKDAPDTSNCYDQCATNWPPVLVNSGDPIVPAGLAGKTSVTTRKDGAKQVTYNGVPLYYFAKDTKPGDTTGQNVGNVWFVVPEGE